MRSRVAVALLAGSPLVPAISALIGEPYYVTLFTRIVIFALAAVGLNLILGYGALVSFGHAMYIGIGAYAVGILSFYGVANGWVQLAAALGVGTVVALVIGLVCLRTQRHGVHHDHARVRADDLFPRDQPEELRRRRRPRDRRAQRLRPSVTLATNVSLYYVGVRRCSSRASSALRPPRAFALRHGAARRRSERARIARDRLPDLRYKLAAYVISALRLRRRRHAARQPDDVRHARVHGWTASGDLIVMIMLGGMATVVGPVLGAAALLCSRSCSQAWTQHWQIVLGPRSC